MSRSAISDSVRRRVRERADNRCEYCRFSQLFVYGWLEIEHIIPTAEGGSDDEDNLCLACRFCNNYKSDQTFALNPETGKHIRLFDPRTQKWVNHFVWSEDGTELRGRTPCGTATIHALQMNNQVAVDVRRAWVKVGWHPPTDE